MSLVRPHPILSSCGSNPFECHKASIVVKMFSGRYLTDHLQRHWTSNRDGFCLLPACRDLNILGDLQHLLLTCRSLDKSRKNLLLVASKISAEHPYLYEIIHGALSSQNPLLLMQLLLDSSTVQYVIEAVQVYGNFVRDRLLCFGQT